jgi:hypothetical protein
MYIQVSAKVRCMPSPYAKPLTAAELEQIRQRCGDDRLVRKLLWEIARLRHVVHQAHLYTNLLTSYIDDINAQVAHGKFEHLFENEPVVMERQPKIPYELPPVRRWSHMSDKDAVKLAAKMDAEVGTREAKRRSRESR